MVVKYNPQEIEKKWRQKWAEDNLYEVTEDNTKPKWYALTAEDADQFAIHECETDRGDDAGIGFVGHSPLAGAESL